MSRRQFETPLSASDLRKTEGVNVDDAENRDDKDVYSQADDDGVNFPKESYATPDANGRYGQRPSPNQSGRNASGFKRRQTKAQKNANKYDKMFLWAALGCIISSSAFPNALSYIPAGYRLTWGGMIKLWHALLFAHFCTANLFWYSSAFMRSHFH